MSKSIVLLILTLSVFPLIGQSSTSKILDQAERGDAAMWYELALMYQDGSGVGQDMGRALHWFRKAAEIGDADAQNDLGSFYLEGDVVPKNLEEAFYWFGQAARQGHDVALFNFGYMFDLGQGVDVDKKEAIKWYSFAAFMADGDAMLNLSAIYEEGEQIEQDLPRAFGWAVNAVEVAWDVEDRHRARKARARLKKMLTKEQIKQAKEEASIWRRTRAKISRLSSDAGHHESHNRFKAAIKRLEEGYGMAKEHAAPPSWLTAFSLRLARAKGYSKDYEGCERLLKESLALAEGFHGPESLEVCTHLIEMVRFYHDREQFEKVLPIIERYLPIAVKWGVEINDPIGLAELLEEYGTSLERMGQFEKSREVHGWAAKIRTNNKDKKKRRQKIRRY